MDCPRRLFAFVAPFALASALGCAGPPVAAPIEGVPICADFTTRHARMEGGLRHPVRMRILEGKTVLFNTLITGRRRSDDPLQRTYVSDDNARYKVEWAQCKNERAPHPVTGEQAPAGPAGKAHDRGRAAGTSYDCGEVDIYKPDGVLETKKGNKASHTITFVPPPDTSCWEGEPETAAADRDAGAPPADGMDAGAAAGDAGTVASDAGAGDAGAAKAK
jgi:hypothetical protein